MSRFPLDGRHSVLSLSAAALLLLTIPVMMLLVLGLAQSLSAQSCEAWKQTVIGPRAQPGMVYDSARGEIVLFGGFDQPNSGTPHYSGETWTWNGQRWSLRSTTGPSPRAAFAMAYDEARHVVVLFGGLAIYQGHYNEYGDTWEWDGQTWTLRSTTGASPRYGHAMAYDSARGVVVMFGNTGHSAEHGTWEWNGSQWSHRTDTGPSHRFGHAMVYDPSRHVTVLYGGDGSSAYLNDMWEWDGNVWTFVPTSGPPPSQGHAMTYDSAHQRIVLFGGWTRIIDDQQEPWPFLGQTWIWSNREWTQLEVEGPQAKVHAGMAFDSACGVVVMFGGGSQGWIEGDTWELRDNIWNLRGQTGPYPGTGSAAYDSDRHALVAFDFQHSTFFDRAWEYSNGVWTSRFAANAPIVRFGHALAYDAARHVIVMFGGRISGAPTSETWEWNGRQWNYRTSAGPSPRWAHAMCYDNARGRVVMFGGTTTNSAGMDDMWTWDGSEWTPITGSLPPKRHSHSMSFDSVREVSVLFGGRNSSTFYQDTWEWNGEVWSQRADSGPPATSEGCAMAFDTARAVTLLVSDRYEINDDHCEVWEWDGIAWTLQTPFGPRYRDNAAIAYDSARGATVVFGGRSAGNLGDTWEFSSTVRITNQPVNQTVFTGQQVHFSVAGIAPGPLSYQWYKGDVALTDGGSFSGVHSPTLTIDPVTLAHQGAYHVAVIDQCGLASTPAILTARIDLTNDGKINVDDLLKLIEAWGPCSGACLADLNLDGIVNVSDLQLLLNIWG